MKFDLNTEELKAGIINGAIAGLRKSADIIKKDAKQKSPVLTGALRDSIDILRDEGTYIEIGSQIDYAFLQHETNPNGKAFFLRNAVIDNENNMINIIAEEIENRISR